MMEVSSSLRMVYVTIQKVLRKVSLSRPIRIGAPIFLSSTHDKLLGVVYALTQFRKFIWGTRFTLYTDHKALCYIHSQKNANSMLIKWLDVILDYNFNVVHVRGLDNILPDKLSRLYPPKEPVEHEQDLNEGKRISSFRSNYATSNDINNKKRHRAHVKHNVSINVILVDHKPTTSDAQPHF
ncbi:hypothetical protein G6F20_013555 [Rhizopus arrhizus]|nr:hypothetical protein G6F20_013555 [Rhizopus arrhizus]KAG1145816.1 hypothetical protein G6F36_015100 [Rhizopus arrhizus]